LIEAVNRLEREHLEVKTQVVDLGSARKLMRFFNEHFSKATPQEQRELVKEVIHSLVVKTTYISAHYFAKASEDLFSADLGGFDQGPRVKGEIKNPLSGAEVAAPTGGFDSALRKTLVWTNFDLVEVNGFEPMTFAMPLRRSTN
jgi:hypothetical protein